MSADRDVTRIVRSWLEEGRTALPDRVLDTVLDQLPATPQRRAWWPARRFSSMNMFAKFAAATAAVAVVAIVGFLAWPKAGGVGTPGPSATTVPTTSSSPGASPLLLPATGPLDAGTYYMAEGGTNTARVTFTVPEGWATRDGFVFTGPASTKTPTTDYGSVEFLTWIVSHVYTDVCHWQGNLTSAGTTVDQLATALRNQKGRTASTATDVTLGGLPATRIAFSVPATLDASTCDSGISGSGIIRFWPDPGPDEGGGLCCSAAGSTDVVYIVDVPGKPFVIVARHQASSTAAEIAELDAIVASIRLGPPAAGPSPSPSR